MRLTRRTVLASTLASAVTAPSIAQQGGPIRIIYPFAAGGAGDGLVRYLADELRKATGETVIVENRTGADGRIGVRAVVQAPPDGRTLLFTPFGPIVVHPTVYGASLPYDPLKDLRPVSQVVRIEFALSAGPMVPAKALPDAVAWLRANADKAAFGTPGAGTIPHFSGILFSAAAKLDLRHVPYRGTAPAMNDLVAGQIPLVSSPASDAGELHKAGKIAMLATTGARRSPFTPDVPTYREQGFDIEAEGWYALYLPAAAPPAIAERYAKVFSDAVQSPQGRAILENFRLPPSGTTPDELQRIQQADFQRWAPPIKASGFKPDD